MKGNGFVGFFDILGYKEIIIKNEIDHVSKIITDILEVLPTKALDSVISIYPEGTTKEVIKRPLAKLQSKLISDSILLAYSDDAPPMPPVVQTMVFLHYVSRLLRLSFEKGLPLRGAIDRGEYFLSDSGQCFAGKPLINCYQLGGSLDLAGCAITDDCVQYIFETAKLDKANKAISLFKSFMLSHLAPMKDGQSQELSLINWFFPLTDWDAKPDDIRTWIIDSFHAHNKQISPAVISKVTNTEIMLHRMKN